MGRDNVFRRHNEMVAGSRGFKMSWVGWQTPGCPCKAVWAPLQMLWDKLLESLEWGLWISFCRQMDGSSNGEDTLISTVTFSIVRSPGKKKNLSQVCGRNEAPRDRTWEPLMKLSFSGLSIWDLISSWVGRGKGALMVVTCVQSVPDVADDILSFSRVFLKILPSPPCSEQCVLQLNPSVQWKHTCWKRKCH